MHDIPFETDAAHRIPREDFDTATSSTSVGELGTVERVAINRGFVSVSPFRPTARVSTIRITRTLASIVILAKNVRASHSHGVYFKTERQLRCKNLW